MRTIEVRDKLSTIVVLILSLVILIACQTQNEIDTIDLTPTELSEAVEIYEVNKFQRGYTLVAPLTSTNTYLIDMEGYVVNKWESDYTPNNSVYLLEDGSLLRTEKIEPNPVFSGSRGQGGRVAKYSFEGSLIWAWNYSSNTFCQHHDVELLPNGNILVIAWEVKTNEEAVKEGRIPDNIVPAGIWPEHIIEVKPIGATGGEIVWEWHQWDHMIQDFDESKDNYGNVSEHPELIDVNFVQTAKLDVTHLNGIEYIDEHDLIVLSAHGYSEIWIIDHSTTTGEAASHSGGNSDKGGDLLYRWGNPEAHKNGTSTDQTSFKQHNPVWLDGVPSNGGNLLFFNNGDVNKERGYSTVDEILLPIDNNGNFNMTQSVLNNPTSVEWRFQQEGLFSHFISGAQRLKNGNTLICEGNKGLLHEVTVDKETVWKYNLPLQQKPIFRANRYLKDYPAFYGRPLERLEINIE